MNKQWIATPTHTKQIMDNYKISMKKSLGQNFLIEPNILRRMIEVGEINSNTTVIEIGPGIGALTQFLAEHGKEVLAYEIDGNFVEILKETLSDYDNVKVIHQDILKVDFSAPEYQYLLEKEDLVVCANLPYYITTPIILHLIQSRLPFQRLIMMMQKEVADRMTAEVGTKAYNSLTLALQNTMAISTAMIVPKTVFIPRPNVDSAILKLVRRAEPLVEVEDNQDFEAFTRMCFGQRRKTLWNNLKAGLFPSGIIQDQLLEIFSGAEINAQRRAESLSIFEFASLYQHYLLIKKNNIL